MASIKTVAQYAGVSTATVSRVLNGHPSCSAETKTKVNQAIHALGYQPNSIAQSLRLQKTGTFITVVNDIRNPIFADIIRGMEDVAFEQGYSMLVGNSGASRQREAAYLQYFHSRKVDGIVLITPRAAMPDILNLAEKIPVVLINEARAQQTVPTVGINDYAAVKELTAYAANTGYRRLAYITGDAKTGVSQKRLAGFTDCTEELGIPATIVAGGPTFAHGYEGMAQLLAGSSTPDCVLCYNDEVAIGAMQFAREQQLSIPKDIAFCGFDDIPSARFLSPALTTVHQPTYDVGAQAARILLQLLAGEPPARQLTHLPYSLCIREST